MPWPGGKTWCNLQRRQGRAQAMGKVTVTPIDVAQCVIGHFNAREERITTLHLQKLVYYCQAWSIVWDGAPLFDEDFKAWVNGPVLASLYRELQGFYICPRQIDGSHPENLDENQRDTIEQVLSYYGGCPYLELAGMTHQEDPWRQAREGMGEFTPSDKIITKESIASFYRAHQG